MDRFSRFKILQALWTRARSLLAWLNVPHHRDAQARAYRWSQIQVAERQTRDGIVRSTGDPDSYVRPQGQDQAARAQQSQEASQRAQWEAQRQWQEAGQRAQQRRGR
jgi:hypothetical protein